MASNTPTRLVTHSEDFHTDDVFATAMLLALFPGAEVIRSRDPDVIAKGDIVYDVGKVYDPAAGRFDHHQLNAGRRSNGITYSAFGLLWREYGKQYCGGDAEVADIIEQRLVTPIDAIDNGQTIVDLLYDDVSATVQGQRDLVRLYNSADDKRVVVMDKQVSVSNVLDAVPDLLYLVSPRVDTWSALALPVRPHSFETRWPFPESWRGKTPEELAEITGVTDAIFCHATGFLAVAKTKQGALALATKALSD